MTTLAPLLPSALRVGAPDVAGPLAVFPLTGAEPRAEYTTFARAAAAGTSVGELPTGASVGDLLVSNPTDLTVLLVEGEEVLGAQQNRTLDVSVLVAPRSTAQVPVSCVERGRWDGRRHRERFAPAPQAAYPELRRMKNAQVRELSLAGLAPRADQGAVWQAVDRKAERHATASPTGALHDVFEGRRQALDELTGGLEPREGQTGALVAIGGRFVVLDLVSRPEVWRDLADALVQGYALDAVEVLDTVDTPPPAPPLEAAERELARLLDAAVEARPGIALGEALTVTGGGWAGTGLAHRDEVVHLSAFPAAPGDDAPAPARGTRVGRPSRRRRPPRP